MQITLIRHLPTDWNKTNKLQGKRDIPLAPVTEAFQKGMNKNKKNLKKRTPPSIVLASTLKRTQQTAEMYGYSYEIEPLLDELDFGPFEGYSKDQLIRKVGQLWIEKPKELILGEKITELEMRITQFIHKYKEFEHVLVFGHGSWIRAMISYRHFGDINQMNKIIVKNNECITLTF